MKNVLLYLPEGFEILEASAFIDVFGWNYISGDKSTRLFSCGRKKHVHAAFDQSFVTDYTLDQINIQDFHAIAIPGGFEEYGYYNSLDNNQLTNLILDFHSQKKPIATICTGAILVAAVGLLNGNCATTYNFNPERIRALKDFGAIISTERIVEDNGIITSCNPSTALEVAFLLLNKLTNANNTQEVKKQMGFI